MTTAVALFDKTGDLIYMGQSKGSITVLDSASLKFLDILKVCIRPPCAIQAPIESASLCLILVRIHTGIGVSLKHVAQHWREGDVTTKVL